MTFTLKVLPSYVQRVGFGSLVAIALFIISTQHNRPWRQGLVFSPLEQVILYALIGTLLLAALASLAYRQKLTVAILEDGLLIDEYIRVPWESVQWYHIDRIRGRNGTKKFAIKAEKKYRYYCNDNPEFQKFTNHLLNNVEEKNPAAYDYTRSKPYQFYGVALMVVNLVVAGIFTYFNREVIWATITILLVTVVITFLLYVQFFSRTRH